MFHQIKSVRRFTKIKDPGVPVQILSEVFKYYSSLLLHFIIVVMIIIIVIMIIMIDKNNDKKI